MRPTRSKSCDRCTQLAPVLYRVRYDESGTWVFVCESCLVNLREHNPHYTYGGTWKAKKKR